jgi:hypothetical protein
MHALFLEISILQTPNGNILTSQNENGSNMASSSSIVALIASIKKGKIVIEK